MRKVNKCPNQQNKTLRNKRIRKQKRSNNRKNQEVYLILEKTGKDYLVMVLGYLLTLLKLDYSQPIIYLQLPIPPQYSKRMRLNQVPVYLVIPNLFSIFLLKEYLQLKRIFSRVMDQNQLRMMEGTMKVTVLNSKKIKTKQLTRQKVQATINMPQIVKFCSKLKL